MVLRRRRAAIDTVTRHRNKVDGGGRGNDTKKPKKNLSRRINNSRH